MTTLELSGSFEDQNIIKSRATFERYSMGGAPRDRFVRQRWAVASVYAIILNTLEASYKNAILSSDDLRTYIIVAIETLRAVKALRSGGGRFGFALCKRSSSSRYCSARCYFTHLSEHGITLERSEEQAMICLTDIQTTLNYLENINLTPSNQIGFSATHFRRLLDAFLPTVVSQMTTELSYLEPEALRQHLSLSEQEMAEKLSKLLENPWGSPSALPILMYNRPPGCRFPDVPWFVMKWAVFMFDSRRSRYYCNTRRWEKT